MYLVNIKLIHIFAKSSCKQLWLETFEPCNYKNKFLEKGTTIGKASHWSKMPVELTLIAKIDHPK